MLRIPGRKNMRVARIDARFDPAIYVAIGTANLLAIGGGSWMVLQGSMTLGQLTLCYVPWPDDLADAGAGVVV